MGQVLDLDETLVHSTLDTCDSPDFAFSVVFNGRRHIVNVKRRPHLAAFLEAAAALFEVVVFTASQKIYAEQLINVLDPSRRALPASAQLALFYAPLSILIVLLPCCIDGAGKDARPWAAATVLCAAGG